MDNPKYRVNQQPDSLRDEFHAEKSHHIEAPSGLDLHPEPKKAVRVSKRASMAIVGGLGLLLAFAYGGYRRAENAQVAARDGGMSKSVAPATQAGMNSQILFPPERPH